jgi:acyl-CoA synthetase (AMP-forming)/AMP-acid ligase II
MTRVFGDHRLGIPYSPVAELLAKYRVRDPDKIALVDLDQGSQISFGELDAIATDIAAGLKLQGIRKGDKVLLLSHENLEKILIWLGAWRLGAVICPFDPEINEKQMAALTATVDPALILYHKDIDVAAMVGNARAPRVRFGACRAGP